MQTNEQSLIWSNSLLKTGESVLDYHKPVAIPIYWQTNGELNSSLTEGLKLFYQRTPFFEMGEPPFLFSKDLHSMLEEASKVKEIDWAVVIGVGNFYSSQFELVQQVEKYIGELKEEVLVCGHLINKKNFYCGLHEQFFIVNLRVWERLGKPEFGDYEERTQTFPSYVCGESIHDDYTPVWIRPEGKSREATTKVCGWNFVQASLSAGLPIFNITNKLRKAKIFIYPDDQTEDLNKNIELLYSLTDLKNISQRIALAHIFLKRLNLKYIHGGAFNYRERGNCLFLFNSELLIPDEGWASKAKGPIDVYFGPASGFQDIGFLKLYGFHDNTELHLFDINPKALEMKKFVTENFSGRLADLETLYEMVKKNFPEEEIYSGPIPFKRQEILFLYEDNEQAFYQDWQKYKALKKNYLSIDLLSEDSIIWSLLDFEKCTLLNITDIFLGQNEVVRGYDKMKQKFQEFLSKTKEHPNLIFTGQSLSHQRFIGYSRYMVFEEL